MARNRPTNPQCSRARRIADDTGRSAKRQRAHGPVPRCAPNARRVSRAAQPGIASLSFASSPTIARGCPKSGTKVGYPPLYALSYGIPVTVEEIPQTLEAVWCTVEAVLETVEAVSLTLEAIPQTVEAVESRFRSSAERLRKPLDPPTCGYIFFNFLRKPRRRFKTTKAIFVRFKRCANRFKRAANRFKRFQNRFKRDPNRFKRFRAYARRRPKASPQTPKPSRVARAPEVCARSTRPPLRLLCLNPLRPSWPPCVSQTREFTPAPSVCGPSPIRAIKPQYSDTQKGVYWRMVCFARGEAAIRSSKRKVPMKPRPHSR